LEVGVTADAAVALGAVPRAGAVSTLAAKAAVTLASSPTFSSFVVASTGVEVGVDANSSLSVRSDGANDPTLISSVTDVGTANSVGVREPTPESSTAGTARCHDARSSSVGVCGVPLVPFTFFAATSTIGGGVTSLGRTLEAPAATRSVASGAESLDVRRRLVDFAGVSRLSCAAVSSAFAVCSSSTLVKATPD
jgi:hypothetical protein